MYGDEPSDTPTKAIPRTTFLVRYNKSLLIDTPIALISDSI